MENDVIKEIHANRQAVSSVFAQKWEESKENARFYRMEHYSEAQLQQFNDSQRVPYVLDNVTNVISTTLGDQRDQRTDITYLPTVQESEVKVEVANVVKDSILKENRYQYIESDVFQDGIIEKTGALGQEWVKTGSKPLGELRMFRIPPAQLTWDLNRRDYETSLTCSWMSRSRMYLKKDLAEKYPDFKEEISKLSFSTADLDGLNLDGSYMKQLLHENQSGCVAIEYFRKGYKNKYFIQNGSEFSSVYYPTKAACEKAIKELTAESQAQNPMIAVPNYRVYVHPTEVVYKSEIAQNLVFLNEEEQDMPDFPYSLYHPFWHDGEWWSQMDLLKDPQKFINKIFSMVDHQINTSSKGLLLIDDSVDPLKAQQIVETFAKTGGVIDGIPNVDRAIKFIPRDGFDSRLLSALEVAIGNLEKKAGGQNYFGGKESGNEAASAIRQRILRASASSFIMFDNLSRFKYDVGRKLLWFISKYVTAPQKVRIQGRELTELASKQFPQWYKPSMKENLGYLSINSEPNNSLQDVEADVVITESKHSTTKNQAVLMQLSLAMQSSPLLAETVSPTTLIELMDVDASVKQKWLQQTEMLMQAKMQKDSQSEQKPPSLSGKLGDITLLPPSAQQQYARQFGIELTEPVHDKDIEDKTMEMLLKDDIDTEKQKRDIAFKYAKHTEQLDRKTMLELNRTELEREKIHSMKGKEHEQTEIPS